MLRYIERILKAIIELGTQECQKVARLILDNLSSIPFGALHQELDSIAFLEELAGNTYLANEITYAMHSMGKMWSTAKVECFIYEKPEHYDGLTDYRDDEAAFESYMDSLDELRYYQDEEEADYSKYLESVEDIFSEENN